MSKVAFERVKSVAIATTNGADSLVDGYRLGVWLLHKSGGRLGGWAIAHTVTGLGLPVTVGTLAEAKRYGIALHGLGDVLPGSEWGVAPAAAALAPIRDLLAALREPGPIEAAVVEAAQVIAPFDVVAFAERLVEAGVASTKMACMLVDTFTNGAHGRKGRVIAPAGDLEAAVARSLGNLGEATKRARAVAEARVAFGLAA